MRVPRSGLANNLIRGARMTSEYASGSTLLPNCRTSGKIAAAEDPPKSRADTREGTTRFDVNSGGKDGADSLRVLNPGG